MKALSLSILITFISINLFANPDWSESATIELGTDRSDIYDLGSEDLKEVKRQGYIHALKWPVTVTGLLIPYKPLKYFLEEKKDNPLRRLIERIAEAKLGYDDMDGLYDWLGLNEYPDNTVVNGIFQIPYPTYNGSKPDYRVGASIIRAPHVPNSDGMTFSCATCHSGTFMGKTVMGLTNKRPRANEFFVMAKKYVPLIPSGFFKVATKATKEEKKMFKKTKGNLKWVGAVPPQVLGLDTSLPHVALSLHKRADDDIASKKSPRRRRRPHKLETFPSDSKPMPWWNLKYKTRWLSDGSIVQGNPILTNFLWNELGRGTDLEELEDWMKDNEEKIKKLTAAAFATKAPQWTDFYPASSLDIQSAKRGEVVFNRSCQKCHGEYEKRWSYPLAELEPISEQIKTERVFYHEKTPVKDVGTDPNRWMATETFAAGLNKLRISKWMKTVVVPQKGYVPPPLEGVFLRYPYMHNNSIPNLCALMMKPSERPKFFVQGPSTKAEHYDEDCVGYPTGSKIPKEWMKEKEAHFDATKPGLLNIGHSRPFYDEDGNPKMSEVEKKRFKRVS
jgi:cytochrome c1